MAAVILKRNTLLSRVTPLLSLQRLYHKSVQAGETKPPLLSEDYLVFKPGEVNVSQWKKMDSRALGITRMMVPLSPSCVLQILRHRGFEAYLVGGCVRDLLLKRTPKDFDVITTADLDEVKNQFHRSEIVGRQFPICRVHIKGSVVEVSSFQTTAKHTEGKENFLVSRMPKGCDKSDSVRWKNSMHRDFTINTLFFDPFENKIYDYNGGMEDLLELKLRTLVPAQLSFSEDCARIFRALRIAARLNFSLSREIKLAIHKHASALLTLSQSRVMMEMNYMLSYGAAEASVSLLHRFQLLEILLPLQAAYISRQATRFGQSSMMLLKLLSHLDKLVSCEHPSCTRLWIGLLGFHLALVTNPQHPFVVLTFGSVLYHQTWEKGLQFARQCGHPPISFEPEILESYGFISDDEVAGKVNQLALLVLDCIDGFVDIDSLHKMMEKFPGSPCSNSVFIHQNIGQTAAQLFHVLAHKVKTYNKGRTSFEIDYELLRKGDSLEARFALGKIILNTIGCGVDQDSKIIKVNHGPSVAGNIHVSNKIVDFKHPLSPSNLKLQPDGAPKKPKSNAILNAKLRSLMQKSNELNAAMEKTLAYNTDHLMRKSQMHQEERDEGVSMKHSEVFSTSADPSKEDHMTEKREETGASQSSMEELICIVESLKDNENFSSQSKRQKREEKLEEYSKQEIDQVIAEELGDEIKPKAKKENEEYGVNSIPMWSIQINCNRAIEESRDSPGELKKLQQFLVDFVEKQIQRKKSNQVESNSYVADNVGISTPQIRVREPVESVKAEGRPTKVKQIIPSLGLSSGGKKKRRLCSYCKEVGHNIIGCPRRKIEESSCKV